MSSYFLISLKCTRWGLSIATLPALLRPLIHELGRGGGVQNLPLPSRVRSAEYHGGVRFIPHLKMPFAATVVCRSLTSLDVHGCVFRIWALLFSSGIDGRWPSHSAPDVGRLPFGWILSVFGSVARRLPSDAGCRIRLCPPAEIVCLFSVPFICLDGQQADFSPSPPPSVLFWITEQGG